MAEVLPPGAANEAGDCQGSVQQWDRPAIVAIVEVVGRLVAGSRLHGALTGAMAAAVVASLVASLEQTVKVVVVPLITRDMLVGPLEG